MTGLSTGARCLKHKGESNMNNKGAMNMWPIVVLVIAVLVLFGPNIQNMLGGAKEPTTPTTPTPTGPGLVCPVDKVKIGFSAEDQKNLGTSQNVALRYWVNGLPKGTDNTTTTSIEVSPTDKFAVWFGASNAVYYGSYSDAVDVPCKGTFDLAGKLWQKDTGVTVTMFDEFDNQQTGAANNQSLGVGESVELKLRVKGTHEKYYGNPEVKLDNVIIFDYDKTELDSVKITKDGVELKAAVVPVVEPISSVDNAQVGYAMPKIDGSANIDYFVLIKADDLVDPTADVEVKIYDADYFYNSDNGKIETGHEDQANADIGVTSEPSATVYLD